MKVITGKHKGNGRNDFLVECECGCSYMRVCRWDILDDDEPNILIDFLNGYCDKKQAKLKYNPEVLLCPEKAYEVVRFIDIKTIVEHEIDVEGNNKKERLVLQLKRSERDCPEVRYDYDIGLIVRKRKHGDKMYDRYLGAICLQQEEFEEFGEAYKKIYYDMMEKVRDALINNLQK